MAEINREMGRCKAGWHTKGWLIFCVLLSWCICLCEAPAQELGTLDWFSAEWKAADQVELPVGIHLEYSVLVRVPGDRDDLARLAKEVEGRPDHPLQKAYITLARQLRDGPDETRYRVWYGGYNEWRVSCDYDSSKPFPYIDTAVNGPGSWQLTRRELRYMDPKRPPPNRDPATKLTALPGYYRDWVTGGFGTGRLGIYPETSVVHNGEWEGMATTVTGDREYRYRGEMVDGSILTREIKVIRSNDQPKWTGNRRIYSDWRFSEVAGRMIAHKVSTNLPDGEAQTYILHALRPLKAGELARMAQQPDLDSEDPVRGRVTFTSIADLRPGAGYVDRYSDGGRVRETVSSETRATPGWINIAGWIMAGLIVATLVWLRMKPGK